MKTTAPLLLLKPWFGSVKEIGLWIAGVGALSGGIKTVEMDRKNAIFVLEGLLKKSM